MAKELLKQDRAGTRRAADVERKYKLEIIEPTAEDVEGLKDKIEVDDFLSTSSIRPVQNKVITNALNNKANKEEGKGFSTNDYTTAEKNKLKNIEANAQENVIEGIYVSGIELTPTNKKVNIYVDDYTSKYSSNPVQNQAITSYVDDKFKGTSYNLASYKVSALTILRSSCVVKSDRVCINFVGTISMNANTTTTIFNLPTGLRPTATKDFVVFGQSSNNDGYVGYGYVTETGLTQVRFNQAISSYIRFSTVYDLD